MHPTADAAFFRAMAAEAERVARSEPRAVVRRKLEEAAREWSTQAAGMTDGGVMEPRERGQAAA